MNLKKVLFVFSVSALSLTACTNESIEYVKDPSQAKEIAFQAITMPNTRAAVDGTTFPTNLDMAVAAYQVEATGGSAGVYFVETPFKYQYVGGSDSGSGSYWGGDPARYWPLSPAYINYLAIANANADNATDVTWGANKADQVTIVMAENHEVQRDLMYAIGSGEVTQSGNALTFPVKVDMVFKHAQAWVDFKVKANSSAETAITINRITLNGASYAGTYTVTHSNYNAKESQTVAGVWTALGAKGKNSGGDDTNVASEVASGATAVVVPDWSATALTTSFATVGKGLMIVPDNDAETGDFTSFTINYTYKDIDFNYTFIPTNTNVDQGKHYVYEITFTLHEIIVEATTEDWVNKGQYIDFPTYAVGTNWNYGTISKKAATYQFSISGLTGNAPTVAATGSDTAFATGPTISGDVVSFSVSANDTGANRNYTIVVTDGGAGSSGKTSTITLTQSGS